IPLGVFVAMTAPPRQALWANFALGVCIDLLWLHEGAGVFTIVGPYALGFLLGAQLVLTLRGLMLRRNPLTLLFLSILAAAAAQLVVVAVLTFRSVLPWGGGLVWSRTLELLQRMGSALYTGAAA